MRAQITALAMLLVATLAVAQEVPQSIKDALAAADAEVAKVISVPDAERTFENTMLPLDDMDVRLDQALSIPLFMANVSTDANERNVARASEQVVVDWYIETAKREDLYKAVKAYADTNPTLAGERKRALEFTMRDYRRAGITLPEEQRNRLKEIEKELSRLGIEFEKNIADDDTRIAINIWELAGVPKDVVDRQDKISSLVLYKLDGPSYGALMDYCTNSATRQKAWTLYRRRGGSENVQLLQQMIELRAEMAKILGFANFVDYVVEDRMAKNSATVRKFYDDIIPVVALKAKEDYTLFQNAKREFTNSKTTNLYPWDYAFYKNYLLRTKYAVDSEKVAEYFPMERVVEGLFAVTSLLYGIEYKNVTSRAAEFDLPLWHADVKLYEVVDKATGKPLGRMYTDLYPRDGKYTHAACWGLRPRKVWADGTVDLPLAALVCNFTKPTPDKPSLLYHGEVETFFHEFGHGLHNMLAQTDLARFTGTRVARDFVEAPSQMMENWVWESVSLQLFAKHYKTNEPLPEAMLKGMKDARTLGSGMETQGQFYLGLMDHEFHTDADGKVDTIAVEKDVYNRTTQYRFIPHTYFQSSFGHLVGYEGAYYGYLWSLVYAQDMFSRFVDKGVLDAEAGMYYRTKILGRGGSMDEMDLLKDYLGREPKMDAFLRHLGLEPKKK
ncbi:MAG: Zn-dependent oligopeptidase [Armatimonadota bacterium]|nr:Zn-dependent oligopeptidase [Armatimonadota bacterium]